MVKYNVFPLVGSLNIVYNIKYASLSMYNGRWGRILSLKNFKLRSNNENVRVIAES